MNRELLIEWSKTPAGQLYLREGDAAAGHALRHFATWLDQRADEDVPARDIAEDAQQVHQKRHAELHRALDELVADFISHTDELPSQVTVLELMVWSAQQITQPTEYDSEHGLGD